MCSKQEIEYVRQLIAKARTDLDSKKQEGLLQRLLAQPRLKHMIAKSQAKTDVKEKEKKEMSEVAESLTLSTLFSQTPLSLGMGASTEFMRENLARQFLEKSATFSPGMIWDDWVKDVVSKIPVDWPVEAKISAIKNKIDASFQPRLRWMLRKNPGISWSIFLDKMRAITSNPMGEVLKKNQLRDMRQQVGQTFTSWLATVTNTYLTVRGEFPSEEEARAIAVAGALPNYQLKLKEWYKIRDFQDLIEKIEGWEAHNQNQSPQANVQATAAAVVSALFAMGQEKNASEPSQEQDAEAQSVLQLDAKGSANTDNSNNSQRCYNCSRIGHRRRECKARQYCHLCRNNSHSFGSCRRSPNQPPRPQPSNSYDSRSNNRNNRPNRPYDRPNRGGSTRFRFNRGGSNPTRPGPWRGTPTDPSNQGRCWKCNEVGHKAKFCRASSSSSASDLKSKLSELLLLQKAIQGQSNSSSRGRGRGRGGRGHSRPNPCNQNFGG